MAILTVGFGKTHATIGAAMTAASASDTIEIFEEDAFGNRFYGEALTFTKTLILKSDTKGQRNYINGIFVNSGITDVGIQDFSVIPTNPGNTRGIFFLADSGGTIDRCIIATSSLANIICFTDTTVTINNTIMIGGTFGIRALNVTSVVANFCTVVSSFAGYADEAAGTTILNNCLAYGCTADFTGAWSGKNNATTESSGAPGANPVHNITKAKAGFAYHNSPPSGTFFPYDFRSIEGEMTAGGIKDAGAFVSGVLEDIDGRTRDTTTPNIGATEGFVGFGAPPNFFLPLTVTTGFALDPTTGVEVIAP